MPRPLPPAASASMQTKVSPGQSPTTPALSHMSTAVAEGKLSRCAFFVKNAYPS